MEYVETNFPGHQALVCTHMDGHNGSGNIHVHIVINSLRKLSKITVGDSAIFCRTERNTFLPEHWELVLTAIIF